MAKCHPIPFFKIDCNEYCLWNGRIIDVCISLSLAEGVQHLVLLKSQALVGKIFESEIYRITAVDVVQVSKNQLPDIDTDRINEVKKIFGSGAFFFAYSKDSSCYDLSLNLQQQAREFKSEDRFFW